MNENGDEEYGVEIWDGRGRANNKTPCETHDPVCYIILFGVSCSCRWDMSRRLTGFLEYLHHPLVKRRFLKLHVNVKMRGKKMRTCP
jgi:hypothetical protein